MSTTPECNEEDVIRTMRSLPALAAASLWAGALSCGDGNGPGPSAPDAGSYDAAADAQEIAPDAQPLPPDVGAMAPDAAPRPDGAALPPDAARPCTSIELMRTDRSACPLNGGVANVEAVVVASRSTRSLSGATYQDIYVQDEAGGPHSGIEVWAKVFDGGWIAQPLDVVAFSGGLTEREGRLLIQQVYPDGGPVLGLVLERRGTAAALPPAVPIPEPQELFPGSAAHDDLLGQRVQIAGTVVVVDLTPPELSHARDGGLQVDGIKVARPPDAALPADADSVAADAGPGDATPHDATPPGVLVQGLFVAITSCEVDGGGYTDLTGIWDWYANSPTGSPDAALEFRTLIPASCH